MAETKSIAEMRKYRAQANLTGGIVAFIISVIVLYAIVRMMGTLLFILLLCALIAVLASCLNGAQHVAGSRTQAAQQYKKNVSQGWLAILAFAIIGTILSGPIALLFSIALVICLLVCDGGIRQWQVQCQKHRHRGRHRDKRLHIVLEDKRRNPK